MMRETFVFYRDWKEAMGGLQNDVRLEIYDGIVEYATSGIIPEMRPIATVAFNFVKTTIDRDMLKYMSIADRNRENGSKGGRPKKTHRNPKNPKNPLGYLETQRNPKNLVSVNDNDNKIISSDEAIIYIPPSPKSKKNDFAEFVSMTNDEYSSLVAKLGEEGAGACIEILDNYKGSSGKKYKSDYRAILNWVIDKFNEKKLNQNATNQRINKTGSQRPTPDELSAAVEIGIALAEADKNRKWD